MKRPLRQQRPITIEDVYFRLGELTNSVLNIQDRIEHAEESRAVLHERMDQAALRLSYLEAETHTAKRALEKVSKITDEAVVLRDKALGAGWLGGKLLRFGIWLLGAIGGAGAMLAYIKYLIATGRPPP